MAKRLEKEALAQVLAGKNKSGDKVLAIRFIGVELDPDKGFVLAIKESVGTGEQKSVGTPA